MRRFPEIIIGVLDFSVVVEGVFLGNAPQRLSTPQGVRRRILSLIKDLILVYFGLPFSVFPFLIYLDSDYTVYVRSTLGVFIFIIIISSR